MAKVTPSCWAVTAFWWKRRKLPMVKLQWFIGGVSWWLFGLHHPVPFRKVNVYQSFFDAWTCDHSLCISIAFDVWSFVIIIIFHYPLSFIIMYHYLSSLFIIIICYDSSSILMIYHHFHTWLSFIKMNFSARRTPRFIIIISLIMHHKCH